MRPEDSGTLVAMGCVGMVAVFAAIGLVAVIRWVAHLF